MRPDARQRAKAPRPILMMLVTAMLICGCRNTEGMESILKIGLSEPPRTLNLWLASDANSGKVLSQIYQPLFAETPDRLTSTPWLAMEMPRFDEQNLVCTIRLRQAQWSDGALLTADDVVFTGRLIKEFAIPRYAAKWEPVDRIEAEDARTVLFYLKRPYANFMDGALSTPIVPRHQWEPLAEKARRSAKPLAALLKTPMTNPVGSGPFMLENHDRETYLFLKNNPYFFGKGQVIAGRLLGPFIDGLLFKVYTTSDVAILALKKGDIDLFWWGIPPGYLEDLRRMAHIDVVTSQRSALYFLGFNLRRPPFSDTAFRKAAAVLIDKAFIVERILQGAGDVMTAIVPSGNRLWSNPDADRRGQGLTREKRIREAYALLRDAGYSWRKPPVDAQGRIGLPDIVRMPDGTPMRDIVILTPPADYDPHRAMSGLMIQEWLRAVGIPATARPMAFSALLTKVKAHHDFDAFVLGYGRLPLDPDYLRTFFYSKNAARRGWNMSGYNNPEYDRLADLAQGETDPAKRREIVFRMQEILGRDAPYVPLYTPHLVEAVRTDRFRGWVPMLEGVGNRWSFCQIHNTNRTDETENGGA